MIPVEQDAQAFKSSVKKSGWNTTEVKLTFAQVSSFQSLSSFFLRNPGLKAKVTVWETIIMIDKKGLLRAKTIESEDCTADISAVTEN